MRKILILCFLSLHLTTLAETDLVNPTQNQIDTNNLVADHGEFIGIIAGMSTAYIAYNYAEAALASRNVYVVEEQYPHACAWFTAMQAKYPDSGLATCSLVPSPAWMSQHEMALQSRCNTIFCPTQTLERINDLYERQLNTKFTKRLNLRTDDTDPLMDLYVAEFLLVRQAFHCSKQTTLTYPLYFFLTTTIVATLGKYLRSYWDKSMTYQIYGGSLTTTSSIGMISYEHQELQADIFAYEQSVDNNIVKGAFTYFNDEDLPYNVWRLQAPISDRLSALFDHIKISLSSCT